MSHRTSLLILLKPTPKNARSFSFPPLSLCVKREVGGRGGEKRSLRANRKTNCFIAKKLMDFFPFKFFTSLSHTRKSIFSSKRVEPTNRLRKNALQKINLWLRTRVGERKRASNRNRRQKTELLFFVRCNVMSRSAVSQRLMIIF